MRAYIEYGWPEGRWHAKKLVDALFDSGFDVITNPRLAGVVIAHSGGCYMLPEDMSPKLILHIGLPNWPARIVPESTLRKWSMETIDASWLKKLFYQGVYFFNPKTTYATWKAWRKKQLYDYPSSHVILIRNERDTYMHPEKSRQLAQERNWDYIELAGMHDNIWEKPGKFIKLIERQFCSDMKQE